MTTSTRRHGNKVWPYSWQRTTYLSDDVMRWYIKFHCASPLMSVHRTNRENFSMNIDKHCGNIKSKEFRHLLLSKNFHGFVSCQRKRQRRNFSNSNPNSIRSGWKTSMESNILNNHHQQRVNVYCDHENSFASCVSAHQRCVKLIIFLIQHKIEPKVIAESTCKIFWNVRSSKEIRSEKLFCAVIRELGKKNEAIPRIFNFCLNLKSFSVFLSSTIEATKKVKMSPGCRSLWMRQVMALKKTKWTRRRLIKDICVPLATRR